MNREERRRWYHEVYLQSEHWAKTRERAIQRAKRCCERCGLRENTTVPVSGSPLGVCVALEVHHLNYKRLWQELDTDLEVLCKLCHRYEHGVETDFQRHAIYQAERYVRLNSTEEIMRDIWGEEVA